ncbi:MAG: AAA family ATPase [Myxococcota bacterium]
MANPPPPLAVYRLDASQRQLTRDGAAVELQPKALEVLCFLVARADRVVSRQDLIEGVWDGLSVSSDAVRFAIKELRRGLGDAATDPRFVETVARRGWRFTGSAARVGEDAWILEGRDAASREAPSRDEATREPFVGREKELGELLDGLSKAQEGLRPMRFVRGEAGIGKSRLVQAFCETAGRVADTFCAVGACAEPVGPGMPYAPLFEIVEQIVDRLGRDRAVTLLRQEAPTWLVQLPALTAPEDRVALEAEIQGATQTRMIREWARWIERVAETQTIVLVVEDLQWADPSTLDALLFLARRADRARLLLVVTLRPATTTSGTASVVEARIETLATRGQAQPVVPRAFEEDGIRAYLGARFGEGALGDEGEALVRALAAASSGNPLFVVSLVDDWIESGHLRQVGGRWTLATPLPREAVPIRLKPLIQRQLAGLEAPLLAVLEAASLVGPEFCAAEIAAALDRALDDVESDCDGLLADGRFVVGCGALAWPDGTVSSRYRFNHALHRDVLVEGLSDGRRSRLSLALGERLLLAFAGREDEVAAELARHFDRGLDLARAAGFYARAGVAAARRFANPEAVALLRSALERMAQRDFEGRSALELGARLALCAPLAAVAGYASSELEENLAQLEAGTIGLEDTVELFPAILGLWSLHFVRADFDRTARSGERMLALAARADSPVLTLQANQSAGHSLFYQGRVEEAQTHYARAVEGYDVERHARQDYSVGDDPLVLVTSCRALSEWFLGRSDAAVRSAVHAVEVGERLAHPPSLALACTYGAVLHQLRGDVPGTLAWSERSLALTTAEGIALWRELSRILHGWATAQGEASDLPVGLEEIRAGIAGWRATGARLGLPHFLCLSASVETRAGKFEDAAATLETARQLAAETGQALFRSETERFEGDLLRDRAERTDDASARSAARARYVRALDLAQADRLPGPALQAALALCALEPDAPGAHRRLAGIVSVYPAEAPMDLDLARARERLA